MYPCKYNQNEDFKKQKVGTLKFKYLQDTPGNEKKYFLKQPPQQTFTIESPTTSPAIVYSKPEKRKKKAFLNIINLESESETDYGSDPEIE